MLTPQHRLLISLPSRSPSIPTPRFVLKYSENSLPVSRFGFVVSKRVSTSAVIRNRTKRIFRSVIEENLTNIKKGYDMLFIIRKEIASQDEIADLLQSTLEKTTLWH